MQAVAGHPTGEWGNLLSDTQQSAQGVEIATVWADHDSTEGRLQRGRGLGFRRALEEPGSAGDVVLRCVVEDPRLDRQVEARGLYYARLIGKLGLSLDAIAEHLSGAGDPRLALDTLEALGRYGDERAVAILRRYLEEGPRWE